MLDIQEEILYVFPFGSKVYGTDTSKSDEDFIVIINKDEEIEYGLHDEKLNITVYSDSKFKNLIKEHDISALECIFSNKTHYEFNLDLEKLRKSISAVASNSFVKCKKKLIPGSDFNPYTGKKSLFHSIRILDFGIQIAKYGKIVDFSSSNHYFNKIMDIEDWETLKETFQPIANKLKSEFKRLTPLNKDSRNKKW